MSSLIHDKAHVFYSPHKIVFGLGAAKNVGQEARLLGAKRAMVVTDPGVAGADLVQPISDSLEGAGLAFSLYAKVEPEPPARVIDEASAQFKAQDCDLVIGLGGGSSLDVAKGVSVVAANGGSVLDYCGFDLVKKPGAPKILIPTTAGTGSEVTRVFVLTDEAQQAKKAVYSFFTLPEVALVDPALTLSMPPQVTADTGVDALVHAIETYVSSNATPFSDTLAEKAIGLITRWLPLAWAKGSNLEARYYMSLAATTSGLAFGSGGLGAVHGLAYVLGTDYHLPHGRSNAIMLPHVMRFNLPGNPEKFADIAALMDQDVEGLPVMEAAEAGVRAVEDLLETIKLPYRLRDYDIPEADLPQMVEGAMKQTRLFVTNPRDLSQEDIREIYARAR